jgi:hypothetical protein
MDQSLLTKVPELLAIARENLWTDLDIEDLPAFIELAQRVDIAQIGRFAFIPPRYPEFLETAAIEGIRAEVAGVFPPLQPPVPRPQPTERPGVL